MIPHEALVKSRMHFPNDWTHTFSYPCTVSMKQGLHALLHSSVSELKGPSLLLGTLFRKYYPTHLPAIPRDIFYQKQK